MRGTSLYDTAAFQRRLWTPAILRSQVKLGGWWDAADLGSVSSTGGVVNSWLDKSGNGRTMNQTGGNAPDWDLNGWVSGTKHAPCLHPITDRMDGPSIAYNGTNGMSFHCAVRNSGAASYRNIMTAGTGSIEFRVTPANKLNLVRTFQVDLFVSAATVPTGFVLLGYDVATNRSDLWINGAVETSAVNGAFSANNGIFFLHGAGGNQWWDSAVAEIVWTDFLLTAAETAQVLGYLAWKWWGVNNPLPATHTHKKYPPLIGG